MMSVYSLGSAADFRAFARHAGGSATLKLMPANGNARPGDRALIYSIVMDIMSSMEESPSDLNLRIAERVRELRAARGFSLDALAAKSGVSRSMISLIERGESSPTAVVLEKLAAGLGVTLASLFDVPAGASQAFKGPVSRRADQPEWQDPDSGYLRRNVSPPGVPQPMQIVEIHFPAGQRVVFEAPVREMRVYQQIWVLEGTFDVTVGDERHRLREGDCLAMQLNSSIVFHNPTRKPTRYVVVIASEANGRWR
jgi:transcriptional regulator with XRE-family HTH domain